MTPVLIDVRALAAMVHMQQGPKFALIAPMKRPLHTFMLQLNARIRLVSAALFGVALHLALSPTGPR